MQTINQHLPGTITVFALYIKTAINKQKYSIQYYIIMISRNKYEKYDGSGTVDRITSGQLADFGVHTAWRKARDRDVWHQVVSK